MGTDFKTVDIKPSEKTSRYEDAGTLLSRLGDYDYLSEFEKIKNMGRNSKVWFFVNTKGKQFLGQAIALNIGWKVTVFDNHMGSTGMVPVAKFSASDRFHLEEMMHALYFTLADIAEEHPNPEEDEESN
jgi:hypothetical protein